MRSSVSSSRALVEEYEVLVSEAGRGGKHGRLERLRALLVHDAAWTDDGAEQLVQVAAGYGAFFLRNALALACALGIEDGGRKL